MANISDILNRPAEDVKPPPTLPVGSYNCIVKGLPEQGESSKKKTPYLEFSLQVTSARDDVDEDEIKAYEADEKTIAGTIIKATYYTTESALFMLTDFLESLGIDFSGGKSISAAIDEAPNMEVVAYIKHEPSNDGKRFFARLGGTAKMSELDEAA